MKVSIIVPTYYNIADLKSTLESFVANTSDVDYELIVVDNGHFSGTQELFFTFYDNLPPEKRDSFMFVKTPQPKTGYAAAINYGVQRSDGQLIVVSNDDVLVPPGWLRRIVSAYVETNSRTSKKGWGVIGPKSNFVAGLQQITGSGRLDENNFLDVDQRLQYEQHRFEQSGETEHLVLIKPVVFISGFFFAVPRDVFDEVGGMDESFVLGFEDNLFCEKVLEAGYNNGYTENLYVYHKGSKTTDLYFPQVRRGLHNAGKYMDAWKSRLPEFSLVIIYRAKITSEREYSYLQMSVKKSLQLADKLVLLDNDSTPEFQTKVKELCNNNNIMYLRTDGFDEYRDRDMLFKEAIKSGCNWMISLDADEVFEETATRDMLKRVASAPGRYHVSFSLCTVWDTTQRFRADGIWGQMYLQRMARILPDFRLLRGTPEGLHCSHIPYYGLDATTPVHIRVIHYGYLHEEDRRAKYKRYEKQDSVKDKYLIGQDDYSHLVNDGVASFSRLTNRTLTIGTIVKNEINYAWQYLRTFAYFPNEMVLLDNGSTDGTYELIKKFDHIKVIRDEKLLTSFSDVRNRVLKESTSDFFLHLDFDEMLSEPHTGLLSITRLVDSCDEATLFYVNNLLPNGQIVPSENIRLFQRDLFHYKQLVHESPEKIDGTKAITRVAPFNIMHYGYLKGADKIEQKFYRYLEQNIDGIKKNKKNAKPYFGLACHFNDCGYIEIAKRLFEKAWRLDQKFFQPVKELALIDMQDALSKMRVTEEILIGRHHPLEPWVKHCCNTLPKLIGNKAPTPGQRHFEEYFNKHPEDLQFILRMVNLDGRSGRSRKKSISLSELQKC